MNDDTQAIRDVITVITCIGDPDAPGFPAVAEIRADRQRSADALVAACALFAVALASIEASGGPSPAEFLREIALENERWVRP